MLFIRDISSLTCLNWFTEQFLDLKIKETLSYLNFDDTFYPDSNPCEQDHLYQVRADYKGKEILVDLHLALRSKSIQHEEFDSQLIAGDIFLPTMRRLNLMTEEGNGPEPSISYTSEIPVVSILMHNGYEGTTDDDVFTSTVKIVTNSPGNTDVLTEFGYVHLVLVNLKVFQEFRKDEKKISINPDLYQFLLLHSDPEAFRSEFPSRDAVNKNISNLYYKHFDATQITFRELKNLTSPSSSKPYRSLDKENSTIKGLSSITEKFFGLKIKKRLWTLNFDELFTQNFGSENDLLYWTYAEYKGRERRVDLHLALKDEAMTDDIKRTIYAKHAHLRVARSRNMHLSYREIGYHHQIPVISIVLHHGFHEKDTDDDGFISTVKPIRISPDDDETIGPDEINMVFVNCKVFKEVKRIDKRVPIKSDIYPFLLLNCVSMYFSKETANGKMK